MEHVLEPFVLVRRLYQLGFLPATSLLEALSTGWENLDYAIRSYQDFHGLVPDGWVGPETKASLEAIRFCGLPDVMPLQEAATLCRWSKRQLLWQFIGQLPGLTVDSVQRACVQAWGLWAEVCNIEPLWQSTGTADVRMGAGVIDGGFGTLAWSELPCAGDDRPLRQLYDTGESWVIAEQPQGRQIDLVRVACHELGHALGIPHIAAGNLMAPTYSPTIRKPQTGDIAEAVARYGPPVIPPLPPDGEIVITFAQPVTKLKLVRVS